MPWTVVLVLLLLAILGAHNRIARAIGTAAPIQGTTTAVSAPATAPLTLGSTAVKAAAQAAAPLPNRAPRDPFQALVNAGGSRVPVVALPVIKGHSHRIGGVTPAGSATGTPSGTTPTGPSAGTPVSTSGCAATHVVQPGDSLWSIAQQHVNETGHGSVAPYWHRIYAANQTAIGSNPSQLAVGLHLCLPTT